MQRTAFFFFTKTIFFSIGLLLQQVSVAQKAYSSLDEPGVYLVYDEEGNVVKTSKFNFIGNFSRSLAVVEVDKKYGYIYKDAKVRITPQYESARDFGTIFQSNKHYATVKLNKKWGLITWSGKWVTEFKYDNPLVYDTREGVVNPFILFYITDADTKKKLYGLIDENFTERFPAIYDQITADRYNNIRLVKNDSKNTITLLNSQFETIIDGDYDSYYQLTKNLIYKIKDDKYTLIDGKGQVLSSVIYDEVYDLGDSLVKVTKNGKYGYIDLEGKEVIPCIYEEGKFFENGQALVKLKGTEFYIDKKGNKIGGNSMTVVKNAMVGKWQATRLIMGKNYEHNFTTQKTTSTTLEAKDIEEINRSFRKITIPQIILNDDGSYILKNDNDNSEGKWTLQRSSKKTANTNAFVYTLKLVDFSEPTYVIYNDDKNFGYLDNNEKPISKPIIIRSFLSEDGDECTLFFERKEN